MPPTYPPTGLAQQMVKDVELRVRAECHVFVHEQYSNPLGPAGGGGGGL